MYNFWSPPRRVFAWDKKKMPWGDAHLYGKGCTAGFMENPAGWHEGRMFTYSVKRMIREGIGLCPECFKRYTDERWEGIQHRDQVRT